METFFSAKLEVFKHYGSINESTENKNIRQQTKSRPFPLNKIMTLFTSLTNSL